ncbi:hypothetical protein FC50_GL001941 [Lacticaseibacillus pantheris DSM 15945 = JCM 12539 = NBRC 106106]|uniref:Uncharacterized protein n=1 Tax=Lacticaseibacillus pantheris DSM 15945 = JCM 12539 = NBRC 106106 TaxID=1423783 RepID=A0A0R1TUG4_9LACO|nr:hypothetical protein [Lacticaseibacillus pantheris]KRL84927.1 hypothetical protein FC50_GL001941 [Lacticaseibacillus pantheris DSM 15945 = JCM 12539 = NBRC 106106]
MLIAMLGMKRQLEFNQVRVRAQFRQWSARLMRLGISEQAVSQWSDAWMEAFRVAAAITNRQLDAGRVTGRQDNTRQLLRTTLSFDEFSVYFLFNVDRIRHYLIQTQRSIDTLPAYLLRQLVGRVPISESQLVNFGNGPIIAIDWAAGDSQLLMVSGFQTMADCMDQSEMPLYCLSFSEVLASGALQTEYEKCMYLFLGQAALWQRSNDVDMVERVLTGTYAADVLKNLGA